MERSPSDVIEHCLRVAMLDMRNIATEAATQADTGGEPSALHADLASMFSGYADDAQRVLNLVQDARVQIVVLPEGCTATLVPDMDNAYGMVHVSHDEPCPVHTKDVR